MYIETVLCKVNKGISIIKKLRLQRRPHVDYGEIIYDQLSNESFCEKL